MLLMHLCTAVQGLALLHTNPVLADGTAGLATTATAFAAIEVCHLLHLVSHECVTNRA